MTLEDLLNTLIQRGWKPFGRKTRHELSSGVVYDTIDFKGKGDIRVIDRRHHHIRELVSKESGLWQFVCENGMINDKDLHERIKDIYEYDDGLAWKGIDYKKGCNSLNYEYRLIESSLRDESELEDFLLSNIKIGE